VTQAAAVLSSAPLEPPPAMAHYKALGKSGTLTLTSIKEDDIAVVVHPRDF
jgi:hypothetical protein